MAGKSTARRAALALTTATLASLALAAPAPAATIGQTGGGGAGITCRDTTVADVTYAVPSGGGTITSFSFESVSANAGQQLDFLVLRPAGGTNYTVVGKTGLKTLAGTGAVETFLPVAPIAVQENDIIGFWLPSPVSNRFVNCIRLSSLTDPGDITSDDTSNPTVGATISMPYGPEASHANLSANLTPGPTSKAQCKNGGWKSFGTFKNQGACVTLFDT